VTIHCQYKGHGHSDNAGGIATVTTLRPQCCHGDNTLSIRITHRIYSYFSQNIQEALLAAPVAMPPVLTMYCHGSACASACQRL